MEDLSAVPAKAVKMSAEIDFNDRLQKLRKKLAAAGDSSTQRAPDSSLARPASPAAEAGYREASLRKALRIAHVGFWTWDLRTGAVECSEDALRLICGGPGSIHSFDSLSSYVYAEDRASFFGDLTGTLFHGLPLFSDFRVMDASATVRWLHSEGEVTPGPGGDSAFLFATIQETEGQAVLPPEAEDLTADSVQDIIYAITDSIEKSVEDPMNAISESMVLATPDGLIIAINEVAARRLGGTPDSMIGTNVFTYMPPAVAAPRQALFEDVIRRKIPLRHEDEREGRVYDQTIYPIVSAGGNVTRLAVFAADITDKRKAQQALRESEEKLRSLIAQSADGIMLLDEACTVLEFNRGYEAITGLPREQVLGKPVWDLQYRLSTEGEPVETALPRLEREYKTGLRSLLELGHCPQSSQYIRRADGQVRALESSTFRVSTDKQTLIGTITRDVTDQKAAEEAIRESLREKDVLLKEIHHRVKNNLQIISSILSLQIDASAEPKTGNVLQACQDRIKSMALIHERLYMSDNFSRISFGEYLGNLASYLSHNYKDREENINLTIEADGLWLGIDTAIPCGLIVNELLANAYKYAFPGGKDGEILIRMEKCENGQYRLEVADNGIGLPRTVDVKNTSTLGLQLVNLLAQQLEGTVALDLKHGTMFTVEFAENRISDYRR